MRLFPGHALAPEPMEMNFGDLVVTPAVARQQRIGCTQSIDMSVVKLVVGEHGVWDSASVSSGSEVLSAVSCRLTFTLK